MDFQSQAIPPHQFEPFEPDVSSRTSAQSAGQPDPEDMPAFLAMCRAQEEEDRDEEKVGLQTTSEETDPPTGCEWQWRGSEGRCKENPVIVDNDHLQSAGRAATAGLAQDVTVVPTSLTTDGLQYCQYSNLDHSSAGQYDMIGWLHSQANNTLPNERADDEDGHDPTASQERSDKSPNDVVEHKATAEHNNQDAVLVPNMVQQSHLSSRLAEQRKSYPPIKRRQRNQVTKPRNSNIKPMAKGNIAQFYDFRRIIGERMHSDGSWEYLIEWKSSWAKAGDIRGLEKALADYRRRSGRRLPQ